MFGDWAEHIKLMWARREEKNTLVIKYEELKTVSDLAVRFTCINAASPKMHTFTA